MADIWRRYAEEIMRRESDKADVKIEMCPMCGKHELIVLERPAVTIIKGVSIHYRERVCFCKNRGDGDDYAYFCTCELMDQNIKSAYDAYVHEALKGGGRYA